MGQWDVIVDKDTLFGAFTVEPFQAPDVWASLNGWDRMLINRSKNFSIDYGNRGNVDAYNVPFCLFVSADAEVTLGFETILYPEQIKDEQVKATLDTMEYITFQPDFGNYGKLKAYPLLIPRVAANSRNSLTFYIKSAKDVDMYYYIGTPWGPLEYDAEGNPIIVEEESGNAPRRMPQDEWDDIEAGRYRRMDNKKVDCMMKYLGWGTIDATVGSVPMLGCIYQVGLKIPIQALTDSPEDRMGNLVTNGLSAAFTCASDINPLGWGWKAVTLVNALFNTAMNVYGVSGCMDGGGDGKKVKAVGSYDPNEMIGPSGFGDNHYMKPAPEMSYTVTFENKSTATAPAPEVFVYDTLDAKVYDFESFAFTSFGWADTIFSVDGQNMKEFVQDVKMSAEMTVRVSGQFDAEKGVAKWSFITLDKDLQPEEDPDKGFLVPNNANHEGEGFVMYGINHKADLGSGTKIANEATIIFDANAPIKTNRYINTLDSERPESKVLSAIPDEDGKLVVTWQALDAASGIAAVDLYQSVNKDEYKLVEHYTDGITSAKLAFDKDKTYCFAVVAVDNVGWLENKDAEKLSCEATYEPEDQAIDQITNDQLPITNKVIIDGNLYILHDGKIYTAQGQEIIVP